MRTPEDMDEREARELFARIRVDERPGFRDDLRARLLAQVGPMASARRSSPWWVLRLPRFVVGAVAVFAMLLGGGGLAAGASLPGDALFGVKRAAEELVLALAPDPSARASRLSDQAEARLAELRRAPEASRGRAAVEYAAAVGRLAGAAGEAQREGQELPENAAGSLGEAVEVLQDLEERVPEQARDAIKNAIDAVGGEKVPPGRERERPARPSQERKRP